MKSKSFTLVLLLCAFSIYGQTTDSIKAENTFTNLEEALKNQSNVLRLDLSNQFFDKLPASIAKFKNLTYLSLKNNYTTNPESR